MMWIRSASRLKAIVSAAVLLATPISADDFADGLAAYDGGDYEAAVEAWHRAAQAGNADVMTALANAHMQGEGVPPDPTAAVRWYREAAERGSAVGQLNLGDMLSRGVGVAPDPIGAYVWLGRAARQGNAWAAERQKDIARTLTDEQLKDARTRLERDPPKASSP